MSEKQKRAARGRQGRAARAGSLVKDFDDGTTGDSRAAVAGCQ